MSSICASKTTLNWISESVIRFCLSKSEKTSQKVAIYAPGLDASFADDAIDGLRLCWPVLREFMTFHLGK